MRHWAPPGVMAPRSSRWPVTAALSRSELFADAQGVGVDDAVADVVAERADVGDVVVEAFELEQHRPQSPVALSGRTGAQASSTARQ